MQIRSQSNKSAFFEHLIFKNQTLLFSSQKNSFTFFGTEFAYTINARAIPLHLKL